MSGEELVAEHVAGRDSRVDQVRIRLTVAEKQYLGAAAEASDVSLSEFMRAASFAVADRMPAAPTVFELI